MNFIKDHAWVLTSGGTGASAMLLHSKGALFPVFNGKMDIPPPFFLERALKNITLYSLQGLTEEVKLLEAMLQPFGIHARENVNFKLMTLEEGPASVKVPAGLSFRFAAKNDMTELLPLQAAYEEEEVLPTGAILDIRVCRCNLERIITKERALVAVLGGRIVGKINTNAKSYSRCQIGGVYVLPEHRGKGVASGLTSVFSRLLLSENKGVNLFVNVNNAAARKAYRRCGFHDLSDYKIVYI
ncbi:MAG: GNAT family N-acetyltransferase [Spirochaetaceae bacterium]|jgi:predicted GNAT family acetyltransferase|nr:GNAT family N-acetyltransferase [Spirochaetaceae bacterium]